MTTRSMDEALAAKGRVEAGLLARAGVTGIDVGQDADGTPVIRIYVADAAARAGLPTTIDDVPVEVVERRFGLQ